MHLLYILGYYIIACAYFLIKVGFHWIVPRDCTVGFTRRDHPGNPGGGIRVGSCHRSFCTYIFMLHIVHLYWFT